MDKRLWVERNKDGSWDAFSDDGAHLKFGKGKGQFTPGDLMKKSFKATLRNGKHPLFIKVVKGMLPKTKLGAAQLKNLHVFNGAEHPFGDMNPKKIDLKNVK